MSTTAIENLPGKTRVAKDLDDLFAALGADLIAAAHESVQERDVFHLALSGGSTPEPFYELLVTDPRWRNMPWDKTHIWIVDERRVPEDHEKSNIRMIRESLTEHAGMRKRQVHPMPVMMDDPATEYETVFKEVFGIDLETPRLDFVILGMGDDGHTASLFPHTDALNVDDRWIVVNEGENVTPPDRVTMTYPLINAARNIAVLVAGEKKASMIATIADRLRLAGPDIENLPITGIKPINGSYTWYLDQAAAGED